MKEKKKPSIRRWISRYLVLVMMLAFLFDHPFVSLSCANLCREAEGAAASASNAIRNGKVSLKNQPKQDIQITVVSEQSGYDPGDMVCLDLYITNHADREITEGLLKYRGRGILEDSAYFEDLSDLYQAGTKENAEEQENPAEPVSREEIETDLELTDLTIASGQSCFVNFYFTIDDEISGIKNQNIEFTFRGMLEDKTVAAKETFRYGIGAMNLLPVEVGREGQAAYGETSQMLLDFELGDLEDMILEAELEAAAENEEASSSQAKKASSSQAKKASFSQAKKASSSQAKTASSSQLKPDSGSNPWIKWEGDLTGIPKTTGERPLVKNLNCQVEVYGIKLKNFRLADQEEEEGYGTSVVCQFTVDPDAEPGVYQGRVTAAYQFKNRKFQSTQGFFLTVTEPEDELVSVIAANAQKGGASIDLPVTKFLEQADGTEHTYRFTLEQVTGADHELPVENGTRQTIEVTAGPVSSGVPPGTESSTNTGNFTLTYLERDITGSQETYYYQIREELEETPGVPTKFDDSRYLAEITVEKTVNGLQISVTKYKKSSEAGKVWVEIPDPISFTNRLLQRYELPETGGMGTRWYTFSGIAWMALALMYDILRRKGKESMKQFKKLASLLLAMIMVLNMTSTGFAANENQHTITIKNEKEKEGHTYEAYQVFAGDISDHKLTNIEWGSGVNGDEVLDALKKMDESPYADCSSAQAVADVLAGFDNNSAQLDAFAAIVGQHLATVAGTSTEKKSPYTISVTGDGYYLVKDEDTSLNEGEDAYTKYILEVIKDVEVTAKADVPTIDKKIIVVDDDEETTEETTTANAAVGDTINYKLTSKVPAMDGYVKYFFIVHDTMTKGLTFDEDSVKVEIGETELTAGEDYEVESSTLEATGETNIEIIFKNFISKKDDKGKDIVITYSARLNENAVIGVEGNPNKVTLEYSNNPYAADEGEPDNPDKPTEPTGKTPEKETYIYVTGIELIKIDGSTGDRLAGAEFKITGDKLNKVLVRKDVFTESDEGTYYKLKDGSYTEEAPTGQTEHDDKYESTATKYVKSVETEVIETKQFVEAEAITDTSGVLRFEGLAAGDYEITEIKAPNGYNLLSDPINVNITWEAPTDDESKACTWSSDTDDAKIVDGRIQLAVENKTGAQLPSTGGIGTTIFYAAGIILMAGAVFFVIRRKRA